MSGSPKSPAPVISQSNIHTSTSSANSSSHSVAAPSVTASNTTVPSNSHVTLSNNNVTPKSPNNSPAPPNNSPAPPNNSPAPPNNSPAPPNNSPAPPNNSPAPPNNSPTAVAGNPVPDHSKESVLHSEPYTDGKYIEPPFIKPIHFSDIDQWKFPERNYYVFVCISFVLGFFGMDHFYLRSFGTGTQKLMFNIISFGFWYFWDLLQIITNSPKVQAEGLTTPFDWIRGVGRGVFEDPVKKAHALETGGKIVRVKKDIVIYTLLAIFFGLFGADKFYLGDQYLGIAKLLSVFNLFTFLLGLMWVFWDILKVVFYTESVLKDGISAPPPFSLLFPTPIKAKELFMPEEVTKDQLDKEAATAAASSGGFGLPFIGLDTFRFWYKELAVPLLQPTVGTAVKSVDKSVKLGEKAAAVGGEVMESGPKIAASVTQNLSAALNPALIMEKVQEAAAAKASSRIAGQTGGFSSESGTSGPIIAGTLLAVVLAGAGKFVSDILNK